GDGRGGPRHAGPGGARARAAAGGPRLPTLPGRRGGPPHGPRRADGQDRPELPRVAPDVPCARDEGNLGIPNGEGRPEAALSHRTQAVRLPYFTLGAGT